MSTRTVQRRPEALGASHQDLVDNVRSSPARSRLSDRARSISDVGVELGYADLKGFYRAFRRWAGMTPGEWRAQHTRRGPRELTGIVVSARACQLLS
ncbi:MAG: helix-turn-helix domain-containing protein [Kofleriaceae bacterium]|nr:helix-turn-helix domain-containing protein [Kofleriaceae bacterium]